MKQVIKIIALLLLMTASIFADISTGSFGEDDKIWYKANELADRLKGEKWKFNVVENEISRLKMAVDDLKDIQIYPGYVTNLDNRSQEKITQAIEKVVKKSKLHQQKLRELQAPLSDAIVISIEMIKEVPNHDMMEILLNDNIERIQKLVEIKKSVDQLWDVLSEIMTIYEKFVGIEDEREKSELFSTEFFKVLIQQMGQSSDIFYKRYHDYKDELAGKLSDKEAGRISGIEFTRIANRIKAKKDLRKFQNDLKRLASRYNEKAPVTVIYYMLGKLYLSDNQFNKAIRAFNKTKKSPKYWFKGALGIMEAMFAQEKNDSLVSFFRQLEKESVLKGKILYKAKYLYAQSSYALMDDKELERILLSYESQKPYYFKILLLYAKSLIRQHRDREASEVLKSIIKRTQLPLSIRQEATLALAYLKFEQEYYENALEDFKRIIVNGSAFQPDALYGTVWCYVKMRDIKAAETVLKKLINQFPDSPLAIEGISLLGKWRFIRAMKLWEYKRNSINNKIKLRHYKSRFQDIVKNQGFTKEVLEEMEIKLSIAEMNISSRSDVSYQVINESFLKAFRYLEYINRYYKSGEYSRVTFKNIRAKIILMLKGLLQSEKNEKAEISPERDVLKRKVSVTSILMLDMITAYKGWLSSSFEYASELKVNPITSEDTLKNTEAGSAHIYTKNGVNEKISEINTQCYQLASNMLKSRIPDDVKDKVLFYKGYFEFEKEQMKVKLKKHQKGRLNFNQFDDNFYGQTHLLYDNNSFEISWEKLLRDYPRSLYVPVTLYYLGTTKIQQGSPEGALLLERYLMEYPEHEYKQHVMLILGDYYFSADDMENAIKYYSNLIEDPASKYFLSAFYKNSWSYYVKGEYSKSMKAFSYILEKEAAETRDVNNIALTEEALKIIAFSFAKQNTDEDPRDQKVKNLVKKFKTRKMAADVMHKMALIFRQRGRMNKAERLLRRVRKLFPEYENMPEVLMDLAVIYDINNKFSKAMEIRKRVFELYNRESKWYGEISNERYKQRADSLCESALNKVAFYYFAEAKHKSHSGNVSSQDSIYNREAFYEAIKAYEKFLSVYPDTKNSGKLYYQLAESYFAYGEYLKASEAYLRSSLSMDEKMNSAASFNAVIAAEKAVERKRNE